MSEDMGSNRKQEAIFGPSHISISVVISYAMPVFLPQSLGGVFLS
jgi:hypothetical protein